MHINQYLIGLNEPPEFRKAFKKNVDISLTFYIFLQLIK